MDQNTWPKRTRAFVNYCKRYPIKNTPITSVIEPYKIWNNANIAVERKLPIFEDKKPRKNNSSVKGAINIPKNKM